MFPDVDFTWLGQRRGPEPCREVGYDMTQKRIASVRVEIELGSRPFLNETHSSGAERPRDSPLVPEGPPATLASDSSGEPRRTSGV